MATQRHIDLPHGFSLIELLVAMAIFAVCLALTLPPFYESVTRTRSRTAAQAWQAAATWTQIRQLAAGGSTSVSVEPTGLSVTGPDDGIKVIDATIEEPSTNVSRWRADSGVKVSFGGDLAAPDSAGSVLFGPTGLQTRVVVRAESGFTYRAAP
jgi:prepilin-type N-terminal cleavage/methylation domain-containing protein